MGIGRCKGICDSHKRPTTKYLTHNYCRSCEWWVRRIDCHGGNRCSCCGSLVSTRPRNSKAKEKYRLILDEG